MKLSFDEAKERIRSANITDLEELKRDLYAYPHKLVKISKLGEHSELDTAIEARLSALGRTREIRAMEREESIRLCKQFLLTSNDCPVCGASIRRSTTESGGRQFALRQTLIAVCEGCGKRAVGERYCLAGEGIPSPDGFGLRGGEPRWEEWRLRG